MTVPLVRTVSSDAEELATRIREDLSDINLPGISNYMFVNANYTNDGDFALMVDFHAGTKVQRPVESSVLNGQVEPSKSEVTGLGETLVVSKSIVNSYYELLKVKTMENIIFTDGFIYSTQKQKIGLP